jgi:SAM-dependent methyltransferase
MPTHFEQALRRSMPASSEGPLADHWLQYILATNQRGQFVASKLSEFMDSLCGKRHLDIGSGYGGTCIAVASAGATSIGIELDPALIELAQANLADQPEDLKVTFLHGDIMDASVHASLGLYHAITCDNVIEHVDDPEKLVRIISRLLGKGGIAYITIPNGYSIGQIQRDSHYQQFAITLLEPPMARKYHSIVIGYGLYDVWYYLTFQQYIAIFAKHGLASTLLNPLDTNPERMLAVYDEAARTFDEGLKNLDPRLPNALVKKIRGRIRSYLRGLEQERRQYLATSTSTEKERIAAAISRDRLVERWEIILRKTSGAAALSPS